jgi:hypothetical protein
MDLNTITCLEVMANNCGSSQTTFPSKRETDCNTFTKLFKEIIGSPGSEELGSELKPLPGANASMEWPLDGKY